MFLGYNTNGFANHRLDDAIAILAELDYEGVAITLDHHALNPLDADCGRQLAAVHSLLQRHRLRCVIETGARFLLDPRTKHQPTLLNPEPNLRRHRIEFLQRAVEIAQQLQADAVSFWSGTPSTDEPASLLLQRLVDGCHELCDNAERHNVRLAFEPEPGMFIDTASRFAELFARVEHPHFGLTLDVGHLHCLGEPIGATIDRWKHVLWNVHIEDMRRGVHEHLMFGEGEMDFGEVFDALRVADYRGGVFVELSRHSHDAVETARKAREFLRAISLKPARCNGRASGRRG
jgi:L-ribulose-5-phosphate 3-epimerase